MSTDISIQVFYLDPFSSPNICPNKGACARTCLTFTGRMPLSKDKRRLLTAAFIQYPIQFLQRLILELQQIILEGYYQDKKNCFSLQWYFRHQNRKDYRYR